MSASTETTVADVVAGKHPHDTLVTITGRVNIPTWKKSPQGDLWLHFYLIAPPTSVQIKLPPAEYRKFGDGMGPMLTDYRPQELTITGRVSGGNYCQPAVTVTNVRRHTDLPCESLESMRLENERANAMLRRLRQQETAR